MSSPAVPTPAPAPVVPDELEYHQLMLARHPGAGWAWLSVFAAVAGFIAAQVVVVFGFIGYFYARGEDGLQRIEDVVDPDTFEPVGMLFVLLAVSASIPFMLAATRLVAGVSPRWLNSVAGRIRWKWLLVCMGLSVLSLGLSVLLSAVLPASDAAGDTSGGGMNDVNRVLIEFLLVVVIFVPFQAAAEEYVFRGVLTHGFGSMLRDPRWARAAAVLGPALLFALAHGIGQPLPIFLDRFLFGVAAGIVAIGTGGLEAGIAYHVVNNWIAFLLALFFGDIGASIDPQEANGWDVVLSVTKTAVFVALAIGVARKMRVQTRVPLTELETPRARV